MRNEMNNNENLNNINRGTPQRRVRYGKPAVRVNSRNTAAHVAKNEEVKEEVKNAENIEIKDTSEAREDEALNTVLKDSEVKDADDTSAKKKEAKKHKRSFGKIVLCGIGNFFVGIWNTITGFEKNNVRSVKSEQKNATPPLARIVLCVFLVVLLMFIIIDYVKIFENNQMISEMKAMLDSYNEQEKKLSAELDEYYDIVKISEMASSELGMVSGENQKKVYVDVSEDDTIEGFEVETNDYGAIATIMNALGESAKAWVDVVKDAISGNN